MNIAEFTQQMNAWGKDKVPFLFVIDFELQKPVIIPLADVDPDEVLFDINGFSNAHSFSPTSESTVAIDSTKPIPLSAYQKKFDIVFNHLMYGDSYLTNLTTTTQITLTSSLRDLYLKSKARYKLFFRNEFLVFSPEIFVQIRGGEIFSYPMKGTIDAAL